MLNLSLDEARELSTTHRVIPLIQSLFSGSETPVGIYQKLAQSQVGGFLLESAEQGIWARYSFIGVRPRGIVSSAGEGVEFKGDNCGPLPDPDSKLPQSVLEALSALTSAWRSPAVPGTPPLTAGLVGAIGWDLIREIEPMPAGPPAEFTAPLLAMIQIGDMVVVDHQSATLHLVSNIYLEDAVDLDAAYARALTRIQEMQTRLAEPGESLLAEVAWPEPSVSASRNPQDFLASIDRAKHYVKIGDVFQVVLSQRFDMATEAEAIDIYRMLRTLNPSPYMYLLNLEDEAGRSWVIGSSPEALVKVSGDHAVMHPIAGSRPRGADVESDLQLAQELSADKKERAEHLMLVDLARNDLLKVCEPDSVSVTEFMQIERFSHIMHLVSTVEGDLTPEADAVAVLRATFPAGTLSGAPKPRALEIIDELEPQARGLFGGVVGYLDFAGNADLAIAIRTIYLREGVARVQAGAGIVLDSVPESERQETITKASAPLRAVAAAATLRRANGAD